jgi:YgiT-type zinc finger domain-containing protein
MKCAVCDNGETRPATVSVVLERGRATIVFRGVPAQVCENCGEEYVDHDVSARLLAEAEQSLDSGIEVAVRSYAAA